MCMEQESFQDKWEYKLLENNETEKSTHNRFREQYERCCPEVKRQREQEKNAK